MTFPPDRTNGLGALEFEHPPGTFAPTPASAISVRAICDHQELLGENGIDWGSGIGCLAIAAARIGAVRRVAGLEIEEANVRAARRNAERNGVNGRVRFLHSDSYAPFFAEDREALEDLAGRARFVLANPPASDGDDGLGFRRLVLRGARRFLAPGGVVFLNISSQYGSRRIGRLSAEVGGFLHEGVLSSTDWMPFDLMRDDLRRCLENYVAEEQRGGEAYVFGDPERRDCEATMNAREALAAFRETGRNPLSKWQTHLFRRTSES